MKKLCLIVLFIFTAILGYPQADSILNIPKDVLSIENLSTNTDSLINMLPLVSGREKVLALCNVANAMFLNKDEDAMKYYNEAWSLSDSLSYNQGKVMALLVLVHGTIPKNEYRNKIATLQKAEKYLDNKTHWSLKYRIWAAIGGNYKILKLSDSVLLYFSKPTTELNCDTAWLACLGSYYWMALKSKYEGDYENELSYIKTCYQTVMQHSEFRHLAFPNHFIAHFERQVFFYTQHGHFKASVETNRQVLDSLRVWDFTPAVQPYLYAKFLGHLARAYHHWGKLDSAIMYHDSAMFFFKKTLQNFPEIKHGKYKYPTYPDLQINVANQLEEKAGVLIKKGNLTQAKTDLLQSVTLRAENKDYLGVGMSMDKLGDLYALQGDFTNARNQYDSALLLKNEFYESLNMNYDKWGATHWNNISLESISDTYLKLGNLYAEWNKYDLARVFYSKSLVHSREINYQKGEAEANNALGANCLHRNLPDSAFRFFIQSKALYHNMYNYYGMAVTNTHLADYYSKVNNLKQAIEKLSEAENHFKLLEMPAKLAEIYIKQAVILRKQQKWEEAVIKYESALNLALPLNLKQTMLACHKGLYELFEESANTIKAFSHFKHYTALKDELFTLENNRMLAEMESRFENENKMQQIELLENKNKLNEKQAFNTRIILFGISGFTIISLLLLLLLIRQNKLRADHDKNRLQQKLLRSQLNPHFIFNSLATVQNSIINQQPEMANRYLTRFSRLMRNILESSSQESVTLEHEISTLENYLALQKIRFPDKFDYQFQVDEQLETDSIVISPMLVQPFIENAIEHGFKQKDTPGFLQVRFQLINGVLVIEVEDNGIGRKKSGEIYRKDPKDYKSMATEIIRQRIKALNKNTKQKIVFNIIDLTDEQGEARGTRVVFELPV